MISYSTDRQNAYFDGMSYRKDAKTGYYLANSGKNGRRKRLHIAVWEHFNGAVPEGMHVHHADKDKSNNEIHNLMLMCAHDHLSLHGKTMSDEAKERARINLIKNAVPASKAWHSSEEGKRWHSLHGRTVAQGLVPKECTCTYCGKVFYTVFSNRKGNKFCSNNCKSAFRRKSGVDNEERTCVVCGKGFSVNKYASRKCCSAECSRKMRSLYGKRGRVRPLGCATP